MTNYINPPCEFCGVSVSGHDPGMCSVEEGQLRERITDLEATLSARDKTVERLMQERNAIYAGTPIGKVADELEDGNFHEEAKAIRQMCVRVHDLEAALVVSERERAEAIDGAQGWRSRCKQQEHEHFAVMDELWDIVLPWVSSTTKLANGLQALVRDIPSAPKAGDMVDLDATLASLMNSKTRAEESLIRAAIDLRASLGLKSGAFAEAVDAVKAERETR